jgi:hypothetical protein
MRALTVASLVLVVGGLVTPTRAADAPRIADLDWLEGRWFGVKDGTASEEHWTSPEGGGLLGMHKDVKDGRSTGFEFLRIETAKDGRIVYLASPQGRPATPFTMIEGGTRRVVFENKEHDFPQRILYWLDAKGALHARIEGTLRGKAEQEEWVWSKRP